MKSCFLYGDVTGRWPLAFASITLRAVTTQVQHCFLCLQVGNNSLSLGLCVLQYNIQSYLNWEESDNEKCHYLLITMNILVSCIFVISLTNLMYLINTIMMNIIGDKFVLKILDFLTQNCFRRFGFFFFVSVIILILLNSTVTRGDCLNVLIIKIHWL